MPLKLRPTGLGHGVYKNTVDYGVFCGEWCIGRIYETRTGPADLRWFWALYAPSKPGTLRTDSRAATLDQAKVEFEASWKQWKAWAGIWNGAEQTRTLVVTGDEMKWSNPAGSAGGVAELVFKRAPKATN